MDTTKQPGIQISQIILLGAKFSHRDDVFAIAPNNRIENLPLQIEAKVAGKIGEPVAVVRVRAFTDGSPEHLYNFDVEMAALISKIPGEENLEPFEYARGMGAAALYPFLREVVASITMRGRFGPLWLKPHNFLAAQLAPTAEAAEQTG